MPILEDLKEYAERATAYGGPASKKPRIWSGRANPVPSASRRMMSSPIIRGGR
jgi:hypothetical protein